MYTVFHLAIYELYSKREYYEREKLLISVFNGNAIQILYLFTQHPFADLRFIYTTSTVPRPWTDLLLCDPHPLRCDQTFAHSKYTLQGFYLFLTSLSILTHSPFLRTG